MTRKLFGLIAEFFDVDNSKISDETSQNDIEKWDSLNSLLLIDELEKEYNVKFSVDDIIEITKVKDIKSILQNHGIDISQI